MAVPVLFVPRRPSTTVWILHCIRKSLADKLHERDQKEETEKKYSLDVVYHVFFESDKPVTDRLFGPSITSKKRRNKANNPP